MECRDCADRRSCLVRRKCRVRRERQNCPKCRVRRPLPALAQGRPPRSRASPGPALRAQLQRDTGCTPGMSPRDRTRPGGRGQLGAACLRRGSGGRRSGTRNALRDRRAARAGGSWATRPYRAWSKRSSGRRRWGRLVRARLPSRPLYGRDRATDGAPGAATAPSSCQARREALHAGYEGRRWRLSAAGATRHGASGRGRVSHPAPAGGPFVSGNRKVASPPKSAVRVPNNEAAGTCTSSSTDEAEGCTGHAAARTSSR